MRCPLARLPASSRKLSGCRDASFRRGSTFSKRWDYEEGANDEEATCNGSENCPIHLCGFKGGWGGAEEDERPPSPSSVIGLEERERERRVTALLVSTF